MITLSKGVAHLPDELTYKLTYPVKGRSQEGPLFSQLYGQFGIAYHHCGPNDPHGSTRRLLNGAEFWRVFGQQDLPEDRRHEPEERGLQCIALSGNGKALLDLQNPDGGTPSPGELLESILHAIIGKQLPSAPHFLLTFSDLGHYNLFAKGVLHRDISVANILRYSEPIRRSALDK